MPNGLYDNFDLKGVVDNQTLSSADYNWDFNTRLLTLVNSTPLAGTENVVVTYKRTEFDGSLNAAGTSIRTPFWASVTATAGPNFAAQQAVGVFSATSLTGFVDPAGTVRLSVLNSVVKITFQYEVIDNVEEIATVSTPTAIGAGKARKPTGRESGPTTSTFTFSVALFTLEDLNTIDAQIGATPTLTVNGLVAALGPTGDLGVRVLAAAPRLVLQVRL